MLCLMLCLVPLSHATQPHTPGTAPATSTPHTAPISTAAETTIDTAAPPYFPLLDDLDVSGSLYFFQRVRDRYSIDNRRFERNLRHATGLLGVEINSGWLGGAGTQSTPPADPAPLQLGFDLGVFGALDMQNDASPAHEMDFFPWRTPWNPDWNATDADDGFSIYKAQLRLRTEYIQARAGWFQPSGPGVLGVNWSFLPGTYLGGELVANFGPLTLAGAYVTEYKAPWFRETYHFYKNDGSSQVDGMWSTGAGLHLLDNALYLEAAYGRSAGYLWNAHVKSSYTRAVNNGTLTLRYQLYLMGDSDDSGGPNDNFDGLAQQHFLSLHYDLAPWQFQLEALHTVAPENAPGQRGYFAYRLISQYGGANGAYEPWWDLRSDWDHNGESAVFAKISRTGADFGWPGLSAAISFAYGWDGRAHGYSTHLREQALGFDLGYTLQEGRLKGSSFRLHYTEYKNRTSIPSWGAFKNAFQDERDIKLTVIIPF